MSIHILRTALEAPIEFEPKKLHISCRYNDMGLRMKVTVPAYAYPCRQFDFCLVIIIIINIIVSLLLLSPPSSSSSSSSRHDNPRTMTVVFVINSLHSDIIIIIYSQHFTLTNS